MQVARSIWVDINHSDAAQRMCQEWLTRANNIKSGRAFGEKISGREQGVFDRPMHNNFLNRWIARGGHLLSWLPFHLGKEYVIQRDYPGGEGVNDNVFVVPIHFRMFL